MGVPKFYRWISERYPKINQVITDSALLPEFDHLYLDMNGIIHGCTHPSHLDVSEPLSEKEMMFGIMHYLDRIISQIVKPKVSVFLAIDGVAPRAKLNQQRSRRFRSAKDLAEELKKKDGPSSGDSLGAAFDSNCITPGTEFMVRVSNAIKYFIRQKLKEDPHWRNLKVIFSGHEIPGEGEHKIMDFIREMKSQPGYKPNQRHCMYGQDADLIMLSLVTHEPHFTLLREIVDFSFPSNNKNSLKSVKKFTKESNFQLLHISILREYLDIDFNSLDSKDAQYDLEAIIDDFVFMTFLIGNDFLPHLPAMDITHGAFELLFRVYKEQLPTWGKGNYLTSCGSISDPTRLQNFLSVIGEAEGDLIDKMLEKQAADDKKRAKWDKKDSFDKEFVMKELPKIDLNDPSETERTTADVFKSNYYLEKLKLSPTDEKEHYNLRKSYIEGLMWCLSYYYRGCCSWGWFFPYHYGPMLSDLRNLDQIIGEIKFELGSPLKPFEQLMGCLPPASANLVPKPYRSLMCSSTSPIIGFYPTEFEVDMNGKRNPWEGVNLLPFIDVHLLRSTIESHCPDQVLTAEERHRNKIGNVLCYKYDATSSETIPSFNRDIDVPDIFDCRSRVEIVKEPIRINHSFSPRLVPGTKIPYPGFPSLKVLPISNSELVGVGLNCFGTPSKYETMVLSLLKLPEIPSALELSNVVLGRSLYINWPLMHEAKVVAVSDEKCEVRQKEKQVYNFSEEESQEWITDSILMSQAYTNGSGVPGSGGVNIGDIKIRLKLVPLQGMKSSVKDGSRIKVFGKDEADVPIQMVLFSAPAPDPRFEEHGPITLKDRFPVDCRVILTKGKYRGCVGTVLDISQDNKVVVKVDVVPPEPPFSLAIAQSVKERYYSSHECARMLRMPSLVFNKITGSVFVNPGNYDLGLNLKYKQGYRVLGYTRKKENNNGNKPKNQGAWKSGDSLRVVGSGDGNGSCDEGDNAILWEYSEKALRLVAVYRQKFPQLFDALNSSQNVAKYDAKQLLRSTKPLAEIREWLNNIETAKLPRTPTTSNCLDPSAIMTIQRAAEIRSCEAESVEQVLKIQPSTLYREGSTAATDVVPFFNGASPPNLGDRIVNLCANGIPFGAKGTVVAIHKSTSGCVELVLDKEFIGGSNLQGACAKFRGKLAVWNHLLRTSSTVALATDVEDKYVTSSAVFTSPQQSTRAQGEQVKNTTKVLPNNNYPAKTNSTSPPKRKINEPQDGNDMKTETNRSVVQTPSSRSKQGTYRESNGPSEKGTGFKKGWRIEEKTGVEKWREHLEKARLANASSDTKGAINLDASAGLKAMLGVKGSKSSSLPENSNKMDVSKTVDASAGLKALLGVGSAPNANGHSAALLQPSMIINNVPPIPQNPSIVPQFAYFPPPQPMGQLQTNGYIPSSKPIPREKKTTSCAPSASSIIPSAVAVKVKK